MTIRPADIRSCQWNEPKVCIYSAVKHRIFSVNEAPQRLLILLWLCNSSLVHARYLFVLNQVSKKASHLLLPPYNKYISIRVNKSFWDRNKYLRHPINPNWVEYRSPIYCTVRHQKPGVNRRHRNNISTIFAMVKYQE